MPNRTPTVRFAGLIAAGDARAVPPNYGRGWKRVTAAGLPVATATDNGIGCTDWSTSGQAGLHAVGYPKNILNAGRILTHFAG